MTLSIRILISALIIGVCSITVQPRVHADSPELLTSLAMHGEAAFPDGLTQPMPWVNPDAPQGGTLRMSAIGTYDSLNPFIILGNPAQGLHLINDRLLYRSPDEPFTMYPQLARAIELPDDRSSITFHLDPDARFHDGSPVTADDLLWTFNTLLTEGKPHTQTYYAGVTATHKIDDLTVRFDLQTDNWELALLLCLMPVLPKSWYETHEFAETSLEIQPGNGPYRIVEVEPGRRIVYERDPDYWANHLPQTTGRHNFERVEYIYYRDTNVAQQAFLAGDIDFRREFDARRWATGYDAPAVEDGRIVMETITHGRPSGLFAIVWNQRRKPFDDVRVRVALGLAFDFEWTNKNILHGQYAPTTSLFGNSALAATGPASQDERALLDPWKDQLPDELFERAYTWPQSDGTGRIRDQLREASELLADAGFVLRDDVLVHHETGEPLTFELLSSDAEQERVFLPWFANLERLGIRPDMRIVDAAQYRARTTKFDFDSILWRWGVSLSPGNEQWIYWGSDAADSEGSRNYPGIKNEVLDSLIAALSNARTTEDLRAAAQALDRVLMWGRYVVPLYFRPHDLVAYWKTVGHTGQTTLYGLDTSAMWAQPQGQ